MTPDDDFSTISPRRRHALRAIASAGTLLIGGRAVAPSPGAASVAPPACTLTPAQSEGPYFVDERLQRSDVRTDPAGGTAKPGAPLTLDVGIAAVSGTRCAPIAGAIVDIWHCDAMGVYSDADDVNFSTKGSRFLRGYQVTDAGGRVRFKTIYPGAYRGRAVHIHFKIRAGTPGRTLEFTSQLYFDDALTDRVHAGKPYAGLAERRTRNADDGLYRYGGRALQLDVVNADGSYAAAYDVGVRAG